MLRKFHVAGPYLPRGPEYLPAPPSTGPCPVVRRLRNSESALRPWAAHLYPQPKFRAAGTLEVARGGVPERRRLLDSASRRGLPRAGVAAAPPPRAFHMDGGSGGPRISAGVTEPPAPTPGPARARRALGAGPGVTQAPASRLPAGAARRRGGRYVTRGGRGWDPPGGRGSVGC